MERPTFQMEDLTEEERLEMQRHLGRMLVNLPLTSLIMGHSRPVDTILGNYLHTCSDDSRPMVAAKEYLNDVVGLSTDEVMVRWYGGAVPMDQPRETGSPSRNPFKLDGEDDENAAPPWERTTTPKGT